MPAVVITDTYPLKGQCAFNIDHDGKEYRICWTGDWRKPPDLSTFPDVEGITVVAIPHTAAVRDLWAQSLVLRHGYDSHIRELNTCSDGFPMCKVAVDSRQRRLIQDEFAMIRHISSLDQNAPVPKTAPTPLADDDGIFGYRMERLDEILPWHLKPHLAKINEAVARLHELGVAHFDLSPNNVMLTGHGHLVVIDFGRAGFLGQDVPRHRLKGNTTESQVYGTKEDYESNLFQIMEKE